AISNRIIFWTLVFAGVIGLRLVESVRPVPEYGRTLSQLGRESERKEDLKAAGKFYRRSLHFNPALAESYAGLSSVYGKQGRMEEASSLAAKAAELEPANFLFMLRLGILQ